MAEDQKEKCCNGVPSRTVTSWSRRSGKELVGDRKRTQSQRSRGNPQEMTAAKEDLYLPNPNPEPYARRGYAYDAYIHRKGLWTGRSLASTPDLLVLKPLN